ncbi:F-box protein At4g22390-like [Bidens hawaiensis]|uniref:F-box protein At4g22390-like n=1 Tax=Bidens hawaiensis TaxID=980011 RepID=UPI00404A871B
MASLPQDIVFEIFARLPTKPLVWSRCLSKHWNSLISDYFMKSRSRRMILLPLKPLQAMHNTVPGDVGFHLISTSRLPYPFNNLVSEGLVKIVGTFDGIVVLFCKTIILFNPLTGAFKIVPNPPLDCDYHSGDTYGLCYGTTLDDLKIIKLRLCAYYSCRVDCDVFSLKKGLWSTSSIKLEGRYSVNPLYCGTYANGFLYWIVEEERDRRMHATLIALDVKEMVISKILPLPRNFN